MSKNEELLVSVDGVQQSPGLSYNASGAQITFSQAPQSRLSDLHHLVRTRAMTKAFDLAHFVPVTPRVGDGAVVSVATPIATVYKALAITNKPGGVTIGADVPAATAQGQSLLSGAGPSYAWNVVTDSSASAAVPSPNARYDIVMADATPAWASTPMSTALTIFGVVTNSSGASFVAGANVIFAASATVKTRLDGGDPAFSVLDNFTIDCGVF